MKAEWQYPDYLNGRDVAINAFHAGEGAETEEEREKEIQDRLGKMRKQAARREKGCFPNAKKFGRNWSYSPIDLKNTKPAEKKKENRLMKILEK